MHSFSNKEISEMLSEYTDLMKIMGENKYRVRAYDNASRIVSDRTIDLEKMVKEDRLEEIKGIGEGIAGTIKDIFEKSYCEPLEDLRKELPPGFEELLNIPGLGPKTAGKFLEELEISNIQELKKALKEEKIRELKGMGAKTEENLLEALKEYEEYTSFINLDQALETSTKLINELKEKSDEIIDIETAGSTRRRKIKIGDLDILMSVKDKKDHNLLKTIKELEPIKDILLEGDTKISGRTQDGLQVDFRIVNQDEYPAALLYFTGSKYHNVKLRQIAKDKNYKLNEYGVFEGDKRIEASSEKEIYGLLDLKYMEPEIREDRGEIEAAQKDELPDLITIDDIKGDFHVHSNYSDGAMSIREMVEAAQERGYQALAFTDHSQSLNIANGLSEERVKEQWQEIEEVRKEYPDFLILKGIEVDIKKDGSLDYTDDILDGFDLVIASVHANFNLPKAEMTERIIKAIESPYVNIIGHPTGRMLGQRQPFEFDFEEVLKKAKENNVILEINASPSRFDLNDAMARDALREGVKLIINTDSHHSDQYDYMKYGICIARRAWAEKEDIVNTYSIKELKELFEVK
ncbi:MAG TPA: DNA polymerase/3'-5' exonuclease PolX [Halanaerobiales bacterium]|nr:DNA polymerase/3'-5' exonuclease PolX [Halanaerobiales bacterium]